MALLTADKPLNGYEISKVSGIPRSTIYETVGKLVSRGVVFQVHSESSSVEYLALPASSFLARLRRQNRQFLDDLETGLARVTPPRSIRVVHSIEGRDAVHERARDLIDASRVSVHSSLWGDDATELEPHLRSATDRGVDVVTVALGDANSDTGLVFDRVTPGADTVVDNFGCRLFVVASDSMQVVVGASDDESTWGVYADDPAVVLLALEYIRHDIVARITAEHVDVTAISDVLAADSRLKRMTRASAAVSRQADRTAAAPTPDSD